MKKTRADTLGIHLIFRSRDRKEQVVLQDADASKTVAILETGANYSSSTPHPCVSTAVHDSTTFCQLRLALFILRPRLQPLTTTILFLSPCPAPSFLFFFPVVSLLKLLSRMTAHGSRFRSAQSTWNKYERNKFSTDDSGKIEIQIYTIQIYHTRWNIFQFGRESCAKRRKWFALYGICNSNFI